MKVLLVSASLDPASFNASMQRVAITTLTAAGHEVAISDLYAMGFDPVPRASDFLAPKEPAHLRYDIEQRHAFASDGFAPDLAAEIDKLAAADLLVLQFPLYWFGMPAIMKGWVDRVFVNGFVYGGGKWYDRGGLKGKRAILAISTGCFPTMCGPDGINGDMEIILWPIQNGILRFSGMSVLAPHFAWSIAYRGDEDRQAMLDAYAERLGGIERDEPLPFHPRADFGADWRLKPGVSPRAIGQIRATTSRPGPAPETPS